MYSPAELHLAYQIANTELLRFPYPHIFVRDIFPDDFYRRLQAALPDSSEMVPIAQARPVTGYKERFVMVLSPEQIERLPPDKRHFWAEFAAWLLAGRFGAHVLGKFDSVIKARFKNETAKLDFYSEALLIEDRTNYSLGPHTDSPRKVVSLLFYLPTDDSQAAAGTSIYVPNEQNFVCPGGPHYPFDKFGLVRTMPYLPNTLLAFAKTNNSFHGVEPVVCRDRNRWLLLYDIYLREADTPVKQAPVAKAEVKFQF
jgi:hypothetical protein